MQKIALVGAPTAGKTALAKQVLQALSDRNVAIVDDYIEDIQDRSDNTLGHFASYLGNLQAAIGRWEAERVVIRDADPDIMVTCGTVIESGVYNAIQALIQHQSEDGSLTLRTLQNDKRSSVSMTLLGIISNDTFDYDHTFYLPLSAEEKELDGSKWNAIVDDHIIESAEAMNVKLTTLSTNPDEQLATVLQEILIDATEESE